VSLLMGSRRGVVGGGDGDDDDYPLEVGHKPGISVGFDCARASCSTRGLMAWL
jgi:hypothetical protein